VKPSEKPNTSGDETKGLICNESVERVVDEEESSDSGEDEKMLGNSEDARRRREAWRVCREAIDRVETGEELQKAISEYWIPTGK
jgi:hypothetical protein